jgi:hypothetical protein
VYRQERLYTYKERLQQRIATARFRLAFLRRFPHGRWHEEETRVIRDCEEVIRIIDAFDEPDRGADLKHSLEVLQEIVRRRTAQTEHPPLLRSRFFTT